jgi:drug/metabolite transporter (DMT)-like permease
MVAIFGVLIMILDPSARKVGRESDISVDLSLLFSNIPAAMYFAINKSLMKDRLVPHLAMMNVITCLGFIFLSVLMENSTFSTNPENGIFGWLRNDL